MKIAQFKFSLAWIRTDLLLCLLCIYMFYYFPRIDLWFSGLFYHQHNFPLYDNPLVSSVYWLFARVHFVLLVGLIVAVLLSLRLPVQVAKRWRKNCRFVFLLLLLGPGLMVNGVLKNHSLGRARPVQVEQFGGHDHFTPAFVYSGACRTNCSFVSGHAALAFSLMAMLFLTNRKRYFVLGLVAGGLVGLCRVMQGGHFLSDIVFSFWVTYFTILILARSFGFQSVWLGLSAESKKQSPLPTLQPVSQTAAYRFKHPRYRWF